MSPISIVIPLYRNSGLVEGLVHSLNAVSRDLYDTDILFINDSPDDLQLEDEFQRCSKRLDGLSFTYRVNDRNIGFVQSCNIGMAAAHHLKRDVLLLNSDALLTPGALPELSAVSSLDRMIGFVSPRSNNATICNSPYDERFRMLAVGAAEEAHRQIKPLLPRLTYVPTAVGFCILIKWLMMEEFGFLDERYGHGYNEENDFVMRCNRRGYRAVLANHAFVHHLGSVSFSSTAQGREKVNRQKLLETYPEYDRSVRRYFSSAVFRAEYLLGGLVKDSSGKRRFLYECSNLAPSHNGTFELAKNVINKSVKLFRDSYEFYICCSKDAYKFHCFDEVQGLTYVGDQSDAEKMRPFFAAVRLAQPFEMSQITRIVSLAPTVGFLMLDTIALDCQNLDDNDLSIIWKSMLRSVSWVGYISESSRAQFKMRFDVPQDIIESVALLSTSSAEYKLGDLTDDDFATLPSEYLLIVGNHFAHKHVRAPVDILLREYPDVPFVVLGVKFEGSLFMSYQAGDLDEKFVAALYSRCQSVLFPTHYEGFGLPIMHALAHKKPVVVRDIDAAREIKTNADRSANIHLAKTTLDLVALATSGLTWEETPEAPDFCSRGWDVTARAIVSGIELAASRLTTRALEERLASADAQSFQADAELLKTQIRNLDAHIAELEQERSDLEAESARREALDLAQAAERARVRSFWRRLGR